MAPSGAAFGTRSAIREFEGDLFFACLRGKKIQRVVLHTTQRDSEIREEELLVGRYGRIRDVGFGPDGFLYFATSNRDGRGNPDKADDRILMLVLL